LARLKKFYQIPEYNSSKKVTLFAMSRDLIWERDLIWLLARRELIARYRRSFLGLAWSLLTPIATSLVLYFVLSSVFKARLNGGSGYAAFLMSGILVINHLNQGGSAVGFSFTANSGIITKIRTKPLIFPCVSVIGSFINFLLGMIPLILFLLLERSNLPPTFVFIPIVGFFLAILVLGIGIHVAILASRYQDIHGIMGIIYNILGYATPIIYPLSITDGLVRQIILLNPLTNYVEFIRGLALDASYFPSLNWTLYTLFLTMIIISSAIWRLKRSYILIIESL
jgi:ABC-type polysaccharide/polyol phosphate export permease